MAPTRDVLYEPASMNPTLRRTLALLSLAVLGGCSRDEARKEAPAALAAPAPSARPAATPVATALDAATGVPAATPFGEPGLVVISPPVPALRKESSLDHVDVAGWSADDRALGYCKHSGGLGGATCVLLPRVGAIETFGDFDEDKGAIDPARHASLVARKQSLALASAPRSWAFARDLELTWDSPAGDTLRVGARVKGEAPSFAIVLRDTNPGAAEGSTHPELIALSADGTQLGAIAHAFHAEYSDAFPAKVVPVARVAAQAYNDAGFAHHKKKEYAKSAELFAKGAAADPTFALVAYDLACAYARLADARAERALADALGRAGADAAAMKKRALADDDFGAVKGEAWFVALTRQ